MNPPLERGVLLCVDDEIIVLTALKDQLRRAFGSEFQIEVADGALLAVTTPDHRTFELQLPSSEAGSALVKLGDVLCCGDQAEKRSPTVKVPTCMSRE